MKKRKIHHFYCFNFSQKIYVNGCMTEARTALFKHVMPLLLICALVSLVVGLIELLLLLCAVCFADHIKVKFKGLLKKILFIISLSSTHCGKNQFINFWEIQIGSIINLLFFGKFTMVRKLASTHFLFWYNFMNFRTKIELWFSV